MQRAHHPAPQHWHVERTARVAATRWTCIVLSHPQLRRTHCPHPAPRHAAHVPWYAAAFATKRWVYASLPESLSSSSLQSARVCCHSWLSRTHRAQPAPQQLHSPADMSQQLPMLRAACKTACWRRRRSQSRNQSFGRQSSCSGPFLSQNLVSAHTSEISCTLPYRKTRPSTRIAGENHLFLADEIHSHMPSEPSRQRAPAIPCLHNGTSFCQSKSKSALLETLEHTVGCRPGDT